MGPMVLNVIDYWYVCDIDPRPGDPFYALMWRKSYKIDPDRPADRLIPRRTGAPR
jgi:hypothetical protein